MESPLGIADKVEVQVVQQPKPKPAPKPVQQTKPIDVITRTLVVPQMGKLASRVITVDGKPVKMDNNKLILPTRTPVIKVVDTFEDKTTKTWERDFELSARLIANDINLR
jgi:hypothetical protein